ncbi:MAG: hypothetical protein HFI78_15015 [Lachnospiraceae bacterium]|nr:hypothetical protein [Lachnospiraceae bacterium]
MIGIGNGDFDGAVTLRWTCRTEKGFRTISKFENQNLRYGGVIEYEGEYYYIYLHRNYNLKNFDGFVIHKLGERAKEETLKVCYWSGKYIWKYYYQTNMEIPVYIRKSNFIPSNYSFTWHLRVRFFMEDPIKENIKELEEMRIGREAALSYHLKLVQMWFEERKDMDFPNLSLYGL